MFRVFLRCWSRNFVSRVPDFRRFCVVEVGSEVGVVARRFSGMGGVDTSKWKPRRTQGTVINKTRNRFAWAVLAIGSASFAVYYSIYRYIGGEELKQRMKRDFYEQTEEEIDRRNLMRFSLVAPKRGDTIRKLLEEERIDRSEK